MPYSLNKPNEVKSYHQLYALGLPSGSIRALLAVIIFGGIWFWLCLRPEVEVPAFFRDLLFIIMGHYFASRTKGEPRIGPPPLWLPKGTIRTILVMGFIFTGAVLFYQHRIIQEGRLNHAGLTLILVSGFLGGVLLNKFTPKHLPRIVEDVRAIAALTAGVLLLLTVFGMVNVPDTGLERFLLKYKVEDVLAALVGFYFGSRS